MSHSPSSGPSSTPPTTAAPQPPIPDSPAGDADTSMPLTMSASVILTQLPKGASAALSRAGQPPQEKVTVRFQPVGSAPALRQRVYKISAAQRFGTVVGFLRRRLGAEGEEGVFCYVNSVFAPGLDEVVGNLWRCFKTGDELVVAYAKMPAFG